MDDERRGWRTLPLPLWLGIGAWLAVVLVEVGLTMFQSSTGLYRPWILLASRGASATASVLLGYGAALLAQRHTGARRRGLHLASAAWFAAFALQFVWLGVTTLSQSRGVASHALWRAASYGWFAVEVLPPIGLAIATMRRHRALAVVSVVIAVASYPPPFASPAIWSWLALGVRSIQLVENGLSLLRIAMIVALAVTLAPRAALPEPGRAAIGLGRAATGLWIRTIAVIISSATMLFALMSHGRDAFELYRFTLVAGEGVTAVALGWLALGLLDAARDGGLSRARLTIAGAVSLWCGATTLARLMFLYATLYGSQDWTASWSEALRLGVPLVELAGVALLAAELGAFIGWHRQEQLGNGDGHGDGNGEATGSFTGFGARYRKEQLRRDASGQLGWILLPLLASIVIQDWILPETESRGSAELLMLTAGGCSLVALAALARLCSEASQALRAPGLPPARVIPVE